MRQLRRLVCAVLVLALAPVFGPAEAYTEKLGKVTAASLNMREFPSTSALVMTSAREGEMLTILDYVPMEDQAWYQVYYRGLTGYMSANYIQVQHPERQTSGAEEPEEAEASAAPSAPPAALRAGTVTTSSLRMRAKASIDASVVLTFSKNTQIVVLSPDSVEADGHMWLRANYQGKEGYVSAEYVTLSGEASFSAGTGSVSGGTVNLREEPNVDSSILRKLTAGTHVKVTGVKDGWYKVSHSDKSGYVHPDYLKIVPPPAPAAIVASNSTSGSSGAATTKIAAGQDYNVAKSALDGASPSSAERNAVETALKYLGCRYVAGASNGKTFDCSGYTSWVMKEIGHPVNRSASDQYTRNGTTVNKSDLRPGDLVFFSDKSVSKKIVSHVGIYVGSGYFVHAGSTNNGAGRCVKVDSVNGGHYGKIYKGAKRVL